MNNKSNIQHKLATYKRKYYFHLLLKGIFLSIGLFLSVWLIVNILEYLFHFGSFFRGLLLLLLVTTVIYVLFKYLGNPALNLLNGGRSMKEEEAALRIGTFFPEISDRLLNLIQLQQTKNQNELTTASIAQKTSLINNFEFTKAVPARNNLPFLKYTLIPLFIFVLILLINPDFLAATTRRIVHFNKEFVPEAPFDFVISNSGLRAFRNEDFTFKIILEGENIPANAYLLDKERRLKMISDGKGTFSYTFENIQNKKNLQVEAAGFTSGSYSIEVVDRPDLKSFNVALHYPEYLHRQNDRLTNVGNLQVPEGTNIEWLFNTRATDSMMLKFKGEEILPILPSSENLYRYQRIMKKTMDYQLELKNEYGNNGDVVRYHVSVIPDNFPQLEMEQYRDTVLYSFIAFRGNITDDYGISQMKLFYRNSKPGQENRFHSIPIKTSSNPVQRFYYQWNLDSGMLKQGAEVEYYLAVWDNDGVNGAKRTKTGTFIFKVPDKNDISRDMERLSKSTEKNIDQTLKKARDIEKAVKENEEKLKSKQKLSWQDEKMLKELIQKKAELQENIEEMKKQYEQSLNKMDRFKSEQNTELRKKAEQLKKLMDELLDDETKELYKELQKLLEEENLEGMQENLKKIDQKEDNLGKELERALELFKRWKMENKLQENLDAINEQKEKQDNLAQKTLDSKKGDNEELIKEQEELIKEFEDLKENNEELEDLNQDLKSPESLPDLKKEEESIEQEQQESKESLEENKKQQSEKSQKKASEQMQQMANKMKQMQSSQEMDMMMENLDDLRAIMHNLITLSFDQEKLINEFSDVQQSDPRFVQLGQEQLKIRDDAKIVEDSLLSLANRVFQMESFVTREVSDMNTQLDKSMEMIRERKKQPTSVSQQLAMTSMNNLALLLDDVLQQMMDAMNDAMGKSKSKGKQSTPTLSELQKQLNQKIEDLKKSGKQGRKLSEELAKLAAEQERIRNSFKEMQDKANQKEGGQKPGAGIPEKMEETENDLVNKRLTEETIRRQHDILTRLLESEDALRERDQDDERKGEAAREHERIRPKAFDDYFKLKEQEIELLRTIPPKLYPYYKKEVNDYFKRLGDQEGTDN